MFQSVRNRDVPPETCARNRYKCIQYVLKRVSYYYIIIFISPERYVGKDAFHLISMMYRSQVSFTSIFYSQFTINFHLQVNLNKCIVKPPTESCVIYLRSFLPIYVRFPCKTLYLRVPLVAGDSTRGQTRLCQSLLPFPSALSSVLILQPPFAIQYSCTNKPCQNERNGN